MLFKHFLTGFRWVIMFVVFAGLTGCSRIGDFARRRADKAAYGIIADKQRQALGQAGEFTLDQAQDPLGQKVMQTPRLDWASDTYTTPTQTLSLAETLAIAIAHNRDYMAQREQLFAQALSLTDIRRDYGPIFSGSGSAAVNRTRAVGEVETFGSRGFALGVEQVLATGARVSLDFTHEFVRFLTNDPRAAARNNLSFSIVQPLLRGAGPLVTLEPLRQEERNLIYAVRTFRRYQQDFIIEVAARYYGLLNSGDQLENARANYLSSEANWRMLKRFADGGRASAVEVDQAYQRLLEAEAEISRTQRNYSRQLDEFKVYIGLPIDVDLGPDPGELERIAARGFLRPDMALDQALEIALQERLDLLNAEERVEDSRRRVEIARRNFLPNLDASYDISSATSDDKDRVRLDFEDHTQRGALSLILPLDWTPRRNHYRMALVALDQSERSLGLAHDRLMLEVRDAWRELEESRNLYRINQEGVRLAERRVRITSMMLQNGRVTARDLLEAQDDLLVSRNAQTAALVNHTVQRLRFWNAIERFELDPKGMWYE